MYLRSILALSITIWVIWSEQRNVAAECNITTPNCRVVCDHKPLAFVIETLQNIWDENPEKCHDNGMSLELKSINFPNNTIYKGWFTPDIMLTSLDLILTNVGTIEMNAFDLKPFCTVEELYIKISVKSLPSGIFNGFTSVTIMLLEFSVIPEIIGSNIFNVPSKTLESLCIYAGDKDFINPRNNILRLENLTGSGALSTLEDLIITIPLNDSITRKSFVGLANIVSIDLTSCEITSIGRRSFDSLGPNLTTVILKNNKITTLPGDLFHRMLINMNAQLKIYLAENLWHCDCHLINFQKYLTNYSQNFDEDKITCKSPIGKETGRIIYTMIEQDEECVFEKECYPDLKHENTSGTVYISVPNTSISLVETGTGDLVISSLDERSNVPTFIWHRGQESINDEEINCIQGFNPIIQSTWLSENVPYTFCYIEEDVGSTSPFDCVTYIKIASRTKIWYSEKSKAYVIVVVVASWLLSLIFGIFAGLKLKKIMQSVLDYVHNDKENMRNNNVEIPPPLPERPKFVEEVDPVYSYVGH